MAITSEIIGKLGGGSEVEVVPASVPSLGGIGSKQVMHTVNISPGETWLVAVVGTGTSSGSTSNSLPYINIGDKRVLQYTGHFASAAVMTESGDVAFESNSYAASSFEGNIYTVKL